MQTYKLSDNTISHIAKIILLAILSGTDIVDHLRMIELNSDNNILDLEKSYGESFEDNLKKMVSEANNKNELINNTKNKETIFS